MSDPPVTLGRMEIFLAFASGLCLGALAFLLRTPNRSPDLAVPLSDGLQKVQEQLHALEVSRARAEAALCEQVSTMSDGNARLGRETRALVDALRRPQARGRWGELHLRRVVELAGMLDRCDFTEQLTVATDDGVLRPDLVVHLAGGKSVVVDAKVTLAAYLEGVE